MRIRISFKRISLVLGVLNLILCVGCGPSPAERDFLKSVNEIKRNYRAEDIKAAALPLILDSNNVSVPAIISSLPALSGEGSEIAVNHLSSGINEKIEGVCFTTGSGFGHWGIVVCPFSNGEIVARTLKGKLWPWTNGVYFYFEE